MKKFLTLLLCGILLCCTALLCACGEREGDPHGDAPASGGSTEAENESETVGEEATTENPDYTFSLLSDGTYAIEAYTGTADTEITLPSTYNGAAVTKILPRAFENASGVTSITVPDSILEISEGAFARCSSLTTISLPFVGKNATSVESFGYIFGKTSYRGAQKTMQSYISSDGYERERAFYIPATLEQVTVRGGEIKRYAFWNCTMLVTLILEDDVTAIANLSLIGCENLAHVSIGDGVTEIPQECFAYLPNLQSVELGKNIKTIGYDAFSSCKKLESIVIPYSVTTIECYAFYGCTSLKSIVFECKSGWYRDYGSASGTGMNVSDPAVNAKNLTDGREYASDRWKRK